MHPDGGLLAAALDPRLEEEEGVERDGPALCGDDDVPATGHSVSVHLELDVGLDLAISSSHLT